jgi:hypothetical protein
MSAAISILVQFVYACDCYECGIPVVMTTQQHNKLLENRRSFWCIHGHEQYFPGKTDLEKAREDLAHQQQVSHNLRVALDGSIKEKTKAERKLKAVQKRVGNGVCPCCGRMFQNLFRHMGTKHPEYKEGKVG